MPTVSQTAAYIPRYQLLDDVQTGNYSNSNNPSQVDVSTSNAQNSVQQSQSVVKVLNVNDLAEIPSIPTATSKAIWPIVVGVGLGITIIVAGILGGVLWYTLHNRDTTSTANSTLSSTTNAPTTSYVPLFCNATCYITSRASLSSHTAVWTFENNLNDILSLYNGTGINNPGYSTGYVGQALSLTGTQYVTTPFINFAYSSFTIEAWIKPTTLANNGPSYSILGECDTSGATRANCMSLLLKNSVTYSLYMGFYLDDLVSQTTVSSSVAGTWLHVAFVYDYSLKTQTIYRNGYNNGQATLTTSPGAYVGTSGLVNIGANQGNDRFVGLIDHMFITNRAKSACEILDDATLVVYFSFDSGSVQDSGPNYLTGTVTSGVTNTSGHINEALSFGSSSAYFYVGGLVALGTSNQAFSISLWVKPTAYTGGGIILHVAAGSNGYGTGGTAWCVPFIGLDSSNRVVTQMWNGFGANAAVGSTLTLNVWTHIVETYSTTNGVILYINGTRTATSGSVSYSASGVPNYILLGYYGTSGGICAPGSITPGPFSGAIDELRIYSRELSAADVCVLTNQ